MRVTTRNETVEDLEALFVTPVSIASDGHPVIVTLCPKTKSFRY